MQYQAHRNSIDISSCHYRAKWQLDNGYWKLFALDVKRHDRWTTLLTQQFSAFHLMIDGNDYKSWHTTFDDNQTDDAISLHFSTEAEGCNINEEWTFKQGGPIAVRLWCDAGPERKARLRSVFKLDYMFYPINPFCETIVFPMTCIEKETHIGVRSSRKEFQASPMLFVENNGLALGIVFDPEMDMSICTIDENYIPSLCLQSPNQDHHEQKHASGHIELSYLIIPQATLGQTVQASREHVEFEPIKPKIAIREFTDYMARYCMRDDLLYRDEYGVQQYSNQSVEEGFRRYVGAGFTPFSTMGALALHEYAKQTNNHKSLELSRQMVRWITTSGAQDQCGAVWDMYFIDHGKFGDFEMEERFWPWTMAYGALCILGINDAEIGNLVADSGFHDRLSAWLISQQHSWGAYPRFIRKLNWQKSTQDTSANIIVSEYLLELACKNNDAKMKEAAVKGFNWAIERYVRGMWYRGATEDLDISHDDSLTIGIVVQALCRAYELLGEKKYLESATQAADMLLVVQYSWNIQRSSIPSRGIIPCSNHFSKYAKHGFFDYDHTITHSPSESALCGLAGLKLYQLTSDRQWLQYAEAVLNAITHLTLDEEPFCGAMREGYCGITDSEWATTKMANIMANSSALLLACHYLSIVEDD